MLIAIAEAFPHLPYNVQLQRSGLLCSIEERAAAVERMESEAGLQKDALIEALGLLVRMAETVRYGLEMGRIPQMESDELSAPLQLLFKARELHESSLQTIAYEKAQIDDMQHELNDEACWTDEMPPFARKGSAHV